VARKEIMIGGGLTPLAGEKLEGKEEPANPRREGKKGGKLYERMIRSRDLKY